MNTTTPYPELPELDARAREECEEWLRRDREADIDELYVAVYGPFEDPQVAAWEADRFFPGTEGEERHRRSLLDEVLELQHVQDRALAKQQRVLAELAELAEADGGPTFRNRDLALRGMVSELAVMLRLADRTVDARVGTAYSLVHQFPQTLDALQCGAIGFGHARVILDRGLNLGTPEARAEYEQVVLERAVEVTPGRLDRFAQLTAARLGATPFEERHKKAREERRVWVTECEDGMSQVAAMLPTVLAEGIWDRLTKQAKAVTDTGDPRTRDQLRADLLTELLLTGQPDGDPDAPHRAGVGIRGEVAIVIPALALAGDESAGPASMAGRGPIDMDTARRLAADADQLVRLITHPVSGMTVAVDSYRPSAKMRRYLRWRDGRCRFPSCNASPWRTDLDHTEEWQHDGKTEIDNLANLCRGHHTLKSIGAWKVKQVTPGVLEWTSPNGVTATDHPARWN
ncbi:HNH endonuclease signature motif containing protein [Cryobacterium sp. BB736]|uniref:HNH endonuclease signature motif containing protein n=1 Tax=Cryobacterium sp. BB736 TaxID=2746963 RepID=UPI0018770026|nr:HNH endonuclease signature motif containing protein [Cryobacterium sp. BB736]